MGVWSKNLSRRAFIAGMGAAGLAGCSGGASAAGGPAPAAKETIYDRGADAAGGAGSETDASLSKDAQVTVGMVGDILVHTWVWKSGVAENGSRSYDGIFEHVKPIIEALDVAMLDQETILGGTSFEFSGYPCFNSPQEFADAEVAAGFDAALHASNHALDVGFPGIEADLSYWRSRFPDIVVTGIADTEEASRAVPMIERAGRKIALLNYASTTNGIPLPSDAPWCVNMLDDARVEADFAAARDAGADAIICAPHCGTEYAEGPDGVQTYWARKFVDLGADAVFCNHPHVIQPFEWLEGPEGKRVPVFWSLGNFVSTMARMDGMVGALGHVTLDFSGGKCSVAAAGITPLVTHKAFGPELSTYSLADYTEELAAANAVRRDEGCGGFSRQWCVDFCAGRLGDGFDPATCEFTA